MDYLFLSRQTLDGLCQVTSHGLFVFISSNAGWILSGNFTWIICFYLVKCWMDSVRYLHMGYLFLSRQMLDGFCQVPSHGLFVFISSNAGWILSGNFTLIICFYLVKRWMDSVRYLHMGYLFLSRQMLDGFCQVPSHGLFVFISSNAGWILSGTFTWVICFYLVKCWMDSVR